MIDIHGSTSMVENFIKLNKNPYVLCDKLLCIYIYIYLSNAKSEWVEKLYIHVHFD